MKKKINVIFCFNRVHICVTMLHTMDGMADKFIRDVKVAVAEIMKNPGKPIEGKVLILEKKIFMKKKRLFLSDLFLLILRWHYMVKRKLYLIVHW